MQEYIPFLRFNSAGYTQQTVIALCSLMLIAGFLSLLYGYRLYKVVAVVATALLGAYVGRYFLHPLLPEKFAWIAPVGLGLLGAVGALAVQKMMVFLVGAAVGFVSLGPVAAEMIWSGAESPSPTEYLIAGAGAFLVMGVLSLVLFKPIVVVATSMFGSTLITSGAVHLVEALSSQHRGIYQAHPRELAWAFIGVAIIGVVFQTTTRKRIKVTA